MAEIPTVKVLELPWDVKAYLNIYIIYIYLKDDINLTPSNLRIFHAVYFQIFEFFIEAHLNYIIIHIISKKLYFSVDLMKNGGWQLMGEGLLKN